MDTEKLFESVEVLYHSSVRITGEKTVYVDPFGVDKDYRDADLILITHDHFDHFSPEDIGKVRKADTVIVTPASTAQKAKELGFGTVVTAAPGEALTAAGLDLRAVAAYNTNKPNHPKENHWLGYVVNMNGARYYIAGDTDDTPEARAVSCDLALVPIGGTYTTTAEEAAAVVNAIRPAAAVPTHYAAIVGSKEDAKRFAAALDSGILCRERMLRTGKLKGVLRMVTKGK